MKNKQVQSVSRLYAFICHEQEQGLVCGRGVNLKGKQGPKSNSVWSGKILLGHCCEQWGHILISGSLEMTELQYESDCNGYLQILCLYAYKI